MKDLRTDKAIIERLNLLAIKHPDTEALTKNLPKRPIRFSESWLDEYHQSPIEPGVKSLIIRILVGEPKLVGDVDFFEDGFAERACDYLTLSRTVNLDWLEEAPIVKKDAIPKSLLKPGDTRIGKPLEFLRDWSSWVLSEATARNNIKLQQKAQTLFSHFVLTEKVCEKWFSKSTGRLKLGLHVFFGNNPAINTNICTFLKSFEQQDRAEGKLQNKIPVSLSNHFHISRLNLVSFECLLDSLSLIREGLIKPDEGCENPIYAFGQDVMRELGENGLQWAQTSFFMTPEKAEGIYAAFTKKKDLGKYTTGYFFNMSRVLSKSEDATIKEIFNLIDSETIERFVLRHFLAIDRVFAKTLGAFFEENRGVYTGIKIRDIANSLYYLHYFCEKKVASRESQNHYSKILPAVAKATLGMRYALNDDYKNNNLERKKQTKKSKKSAGIIRLAETFLMELEENRKPIDEALMLKAINVAPGVAVDAIERIIRAVLEENGGEG